MFVSACPLGGFDLSGTVLLKFQEYIYGFKKNRTEKLGVKGGNYLTLGRNKPNSARASCEIVPFFYVCCIWRATIRGMLFTKRT